MLKLLLKRSIIQKLIVHGDYTRGRLLERGSRISSHIESVLLPNLQETETGIPLESPKLAANKAIIEQLNTNSRPVLLAFGGLRYEKGIDILLEAFAHMERNATLLITGPEGSFSKADLNEMIEKYGISHKVLLDIRYIPNDQVDFYFNKSDIVVLPYRKSFLGQSGPLTEGIARSKLVIGPNHGEIGFTLEHFGVGLVYESENVEALANQLDQGILRIKQASSEIRDNQLRYHSLVNVNTFKLKYSHAILYNSAHFFTISTPFL